MNNSKIDTVLFDFDGTLIDHFNCIYRCYTHALEQLNLVPKDYETVRNTVGGGLEHTMELLIGKELMPEAVKLFREHFTGIMLEDANLLPGATWIVQNLHAQGYTIAICTNKPGPFTRTLCDHLDISQFIHHVVGTKDIPYTKPEKGFIFETLKIVNKPAENCLFIGDSHYDIDTATHANIPCHIVTTGSHTHDQISQHTNPAASIHKDMYELGEILFNLKVPIKT